MKQLNNFVRRNGLALLAGLVLTIAFGAQTARAQQYRAVRPFVDCVEQEYAGGAATNNYIAYFGYSSGALTRQVYFAGGLTNFFDPVENPQNEVSYFYPGVHPRVVSIVVPIGTNITWYLGADVATASFNPKEYPNLCAADGANSRLITYQGRLSDGAQAANGIYDLQFQLYNQPTGGAARTTKITLDDVQITNGVFTVQLDLGANSLPGGSLNGEAGNFKLNPAILDAENLFFEIGVRAGTSTGAFTTLAPRQPLTAVPLAMRANTANNAFRAANADNAANANNAANLGGTLASKFVQTTDGRLSDARTPTTGSANYIQNTTTQQTANFNVSGSGTIGGTLTANATNINGVLTATTTNISGTTDRLLNVQGSSPIGTWLTLNNTTSGGRQWSVISTGANNGEGAGKLLFYDLTNSTGRLLLSDAGANITGNLTVSGAINGTATNATNATNVSGGFVQLPLTSGAPPASECNAASQYGRQKVDATNVRLYICTAAGWKFTVLQ